MAICLRPPTCLKKVKEPDRRRLARAPAPTRAAMRDKRHVGRVAVPVPSRTTRTGVHDDMRVNANARIDAYKTHTAHGCCQKPTVVLSSESRTANQSDFLLPLLAGTSAAADAFVCARLRSASAIFLFSRRTHTLNSGTSAQTTHTVASIAESEAVNNRYQTPNMLASTTLTMANACSSSRVPETFASVIASCHKNESSRWIS
eukprot:7131579-Prymnesium_polylepis.1